MTKPELVTVRLVGLPVAIYARADRHMDALQREFDLIRRAQPGQQAVPHRLLELIDELVTWSGGAGERARDEMQEAVREGRESVDLEYLVRPETAHAAERLDELLDEAHDYCRAGTHLLTLATPPDALAYRRWSLGQFVAQIGGDLPVPWPVWLAEHPLEGGADDGGVAAPTEAFADLSLPVRWVVEGPAGQPTLRPTDDLDLSTAPELRDAVSKLHSAGAEEVTVDLGAVGFMDSVGISVLISAHSRLSADQAHLVLLVPPRLRHVLEVAGLEGLLDIRHVDERPPAAGGAGPEGSQS